MMINSPFLQRLAFETHTVRFWTTAFQHCSTALIDGPPIRDALGVFVGRGRVG